MFLKEVSGFLFLVGFCCLAVGTLSLFSESRENINFISPLMVLTAVIFFMLSFAGFSDGSGGRLWLTEQRHCSASRLASKIYWFGFSVSFRMESSTHPPGHRWVICRKDTFAPAKRPKILLLLFPRSEHRFPWGFFSEVLSYGSGAVFYSPSSSDCRWTSCESTTKNIPTFHWASSVTEKSPDWRAWRRSAFTKPRSNAENKSKKCVPSI